MAFNDVRQVRDIVYFETRAACVAAYSGTITAPGSAIHLPIFNSLVAKLDQICLNRINTLSKRCKTSAVYRPAMQVRPTGVRECTLCARNGHF